MSKTIISEGKTSTEAIENGLKQLKVTKDKVEIKVLEENKRSFFSILAPRVIKVEMTLKEEQEEPKKTEKNYHISKEEKKKAQDNVKRFLKDFLEKQNLKEVELSIKEENSVLLVELTGENVNYLIGYRGEVLNAFQTVLSSVANMGLQDNCKVILDIEGYREKREKTLKELADKIARTVIKNKKSVTLEPMSAYERKVIHSQLQNNDKVKTYSIGEEPYRKVVISLK